MYGLGKTIRFERNLFPDRVDERKWYRKIIHHPKLMPYYRLAALVILLNLIFASVSNLSLEKSDVILRMTVLNFSLAFLIRQQYVINLLFKIATSLPLSSPLWLRWCAGKVYHFGGLHIGGFISGFIWLYLFFLSQLKYPNQNNIPLSLTILQLVVLLLMMSSSLPKFREKFHNTFERCARFGTWILLPSFWIQAILFLGPQDTISLVKNLEVWALGISTMAYLLPWMRLKKVEVEYSRPSNHVAIAHFKHSKPFAGSSTDLSLSPVFEWHAFANVPSPNQEGFRLVISRAGDWTGELIDQLPQKIWTKGIATAGVGNIDKLFKKVLWVATGSGIGPCLPHLLSKETPSHLVWSTRDPKETYGDDLYREIHSSNPDARIWNTTTEGRPKLFELSYQEFLRSGAEAVICISNKKITFDIVYEFESRGIPAFGAIWDS